MTRKTPGLAPLFQTSAPHLLEGIRPRRISRAPGPRKPIIHEPSTARKSVHHTPKLIVNRIEIHTHPPVYPEGCMSANRTGQNWHVMEWNVRYPTRHNNH
ncbi:hypothetical protein AVEN_119153-1 [Araneus ventricosus]|uniref:Uncharacterized protein n=1 Tax=Araneus ventricosus TaxID=182803 RepID=A0A4Y2RSH4_ARAVE|nr:hypothetical protein AVEN_96852-1 [Araneus ventricosus]GBN78682.1 hypothetical protein AVEN_119153-1 [Araneus ventricosus]